MDRRKLVPLVTVCLLLASCGGGAGDSDGSGGEHPAPNAEAPETTISVALANFSVKPAPRSAPAGSVTFQAKLKSGEHALSVLRTDLPPDKLPTTPTPAVDVTDERIEVVGFHAVSGSDFTIETQLEPGAYVLVCNIGGHYVRGMRAGFEVR